MIPIWLLIRPLSIYSFLSFRDYKKTKIDNTNICSPSNSYYDTNYFVSITSETPYLELACEEKFGLHIYGVGNCSSVQLFPDNFYYKIISGNKESFTIDEYGNIMAIGKAGSNCIIEIIHKKDSRLKCEVFSCIV